MSRGKTWWISGKTGSLPPVEQAKVWALDTLQQKFGLDLSNGEIAALVYKVPAEGGELQHPTRQAIGLLRQLFARDPAWYPGKTTEEARKRGPKPQIHQPQEAVRGAGSDVPESIWSRAIGQRCRPAVPRGGSEPADSSALH